MPLNGDLSDLSLAELLEFFCNQRKSGRLDVICPHGSGHFYVDSGSIVHGEIGQLSGLDAVYYALALPNASFSFSTGAQSPEQTITRSWQSVVLEGLRLMDEGGTPTTTFPQVATQVEGELVEIEAPEEEKAYVGLPEWVYEEIEKIRLEKRHSAFDEYVHFPRTTEEAAEAEDPTPAISEQPGAAIDQFLSREDFTEAATDRSVDEAQTDEQSHDSDSLIVPLRELSDRKVKPAAVARNIALPSFLLETETNRSNYSTWKLATVLVAVIVLLMAVAVPWGWYARSKAAKAAAAEQSRQSQAQTAPAETNPSTPANDGNNPNPQQSEPATKTEEPRPGTEPV